MSQGRLGAGLRQPLSLTHVPCQGAQLRKRPGPRWVVVPPPHPALPLSLWLRAQSPLPSPQVTRGGITKSSAPRPLASPPLRRPAHSPPPAQTSSGAIHQGWRGAGSRGEGRWPESVRAVTRRRKQLGRSHAREGAPPARERSASAQVGRPSLCCWSQAQELLPLAEPLLGSAPGLSVLTVMSCAPRIAPQELCGSSSRHVCFQLLL